MIWLRNIFKTLPLSLARVTTSGRYIPEVDGLRFLAISYVYFQHVQQSVVKKMGAGASGLIWDSLSQDTERVTVGVELFFVISGFILGLPFAEQYIGHGKSVQLKPYYLRRLTRLEPPYLLSLTFFFAYMVISKWNDFSELLPHYLASAFYIHNIVYQQFSTINGVAWSLEVEVQFYILAPLLARLFLIQTRLNRRGAMVLLVLLVMVARRIFYRYFHLPETYSLDLEFPYFIAGYLLADIYIADWRQNPPSLLQWDFVAALSVAGLIALFRFDFPARTLLVAALLFIFFYATFSGLMLKRFLSLVWVRTIGGMCYSIYLLHMHGIQFLEKYTPREWYSDRISLNTLVFGSGYGLIIFTVCIIYFLLIEKPCMQKDWPKRLITWLGFSRQSTSDKS